MHPLPSHTFFPTKREKEQNKQRKPLSWTALDALTVWEGGRGIHTEHLHCIVWPAGGAKTGCKKTKHAQQSKFTNPKFHCSFLEGAAKLSIQSLLTSSVLIHTSVRGISAPTHLSTQSSVFYWHPGKKTKHAFAVEQRRRWILTPLAWSSGFGTQELAAFSDWPTAITSGSKHFTMIHARRGEVILHAHGKSREKKKTKKKETTATDIKVATSATGRKRPRQLTTREHIIEEKGSLLGTRARIIIVTRREVFLFLLVFFSLTIFSRWLGGRVFGGRGFQWHLREVQKTQPPHHH